MLFILASYLAGMYLAWHNISVVFIVILMITFFLVIFLLIYRIKFKYTNSRDLFLWCLPVLLLFGYMALKGQLKEPELSKAFDQEISCEINGTITMIVGKQKGSTLHLKNNLIYLEDGMIYPSEQIIVYLPKEEEQNYLVGNQITVYGTLQKFSLATNPGQFNEKLYYQIENIDYKMQPEQIVITDYRYSKYHAVLGTLKRELISVYDTILSQEESGALIAMLLGEKYLLDENIKTLYQENGISHVLAISGLHISLLGAFFFGILKRLKVPIVVATFLTIFFLYSYGVLTNFSVSTNRAIVMMVVNLLAIIPGKAYDMLSAMALSAFLILLQNPLQILSAGFILSFGAVLGIAVLMPSLKILYPYKNSILDGLLLSISAQAMTTPFVLYFFYQFPLYSILTNLIILPFITILTLTSLLAGMVGVIYLPLGIFFIGGANYILKLYVWICKLGNSLPYNVITLGQPKLIQMILYFLLLIFFVWSARKYEKKYLSLIPLFTILVFMVPSQSTGLAITFLDVGQGEAIYMESESATYLIDGGSTSVSKVGKYRIQPFLLSQGTDVLDYVIVTHSDSDHINGLVELLNGEKIKIKNLVLPMIKDKDEAYEALEDLAREKGATIKYIKAGDLMIDGDIRMYCLHPGKGYVATSVNAYSTVLGITFGEFDLLLTGDLEEEGEEEIYEAVMNETYWGVEGERPPLSYDILKVAHHGSKYSTSEEFLQVVAPKISIISCGKNNRYHHPHEELITRLKEMQSDIRITYEKGAITVKTDGEKMEIMEYLE